MLDKAETYLFEFKNRNQEAAYEMAMEIKPSSSGWTPYGTYNEQIEIYSLTKTFSITLGEPLYNGNWKVEYYSPNQLVNAIEKETNYFSNQLHHLEMINEKYNGQNIPVYYIFTLFKELVDLFNYIRNDEEYKLIQKQIKVVKNNKSMKIFISHASINKSYGSALVELLTGIGIKDIVFTSNVAYGIPLGENIFDWLKKQISEKCFVVYLLSSEYYKSVACLNEMGAAWIIENDHAVIFLPGFDVSSSGFQNGAIDPRRIGFHIDDRDRVTEFCQKLKNHFPITDNQIVLSQNIEKFISLVNSILPKS